MVIAPKTITSFIKSLPWFSVVLLKQRLHCLELREMLAHVCMQDHVNNEASELSKVSLLHVVENVAIVFLNHSAREKEMVLLSKEESWQTKEDFPFPAQKNFAFSLWFHEKRGSLKFLSTIKSHPKDVFVKMTIFTSKK